MVEAAVEAMVAAMVVAAEVVGGIIAAPAMQAEVALTATPTMQTRAAVGVIIHLERNQRRRSSRSLHEKSLQSHQRRWWTFWTWMRLPHLRLQLSAPS